MYISSVTVLFVYESRIIYFPKGAQISGIIVLDWVAQTSIKSKCQLKLN